MSKYEEIAVDNFKQGYNCAQSVLLAFADELGLDCDLAIKLGSSFGGGMGRLREVCGAISSMFMIAGIVKGYTSPNNDLEKEKHYRLIQDLADKFKNEFGTINCAQLLNLDNSDKFSPIPSKRTEIYYNERPCEKFIAFVSKLINDEILSNR